MSICKKCINYYNCLYNFRKRKSEGYYDETPDLTEEEYFRNIDESLGCVDYRGIQYARANGKSFSQTLEYVMRRLIEVWKRMMDAYPNGRVKYLATHGSKRTRKKNIRRIVKWYQEHTKGEKEIMFYYGGKKKHENMARKSS